MPRCRDISREIRLSSPSWRSITIWRSSANGTTADARGGMGSVRPSPMKRSWPYTVTGPVSSVESVGFLNRTARNAKCALPRSDSASYRYTTSPSVGLRTIETIADEPRSTVIGRGFAKWLSPTGWASASVALAAAGRASSRLAASATSRTRSGLLGSTLVTTLMRAGATPWSIS